MIEETSLVVVINTVFIWGLFWDSYVCSRRRLGPLVDDDLVGQGYHIQQSRGRGVSEEVNGDCRGLVWSSNEYPRLILARFGAAVPVTVRPL